MEVVWYDSRDVVMNIHEGLLVLMSRRGPNLHNYEYVMSWA